MIPWSLVDVCLNASKFLCEFKNKIQRRRFGTSTRYGIVSSNWLLVVLKLLCNIIPLVCKRGRLIHYQY